MPFDRSPIRLNPINITLLCLFSQMSVERGMSWEEATHAWADQNGADDGFYVQVREGEWSFSIIN